MSRADRGAEDDLSRARRLSVISLFYLGTNLVLLFLVMGGSQALKTELFGDMMSIIPSALFLIGDRINRKPPTELYPFGFARAVSAAYLGASLALLAAGLFLFLDSSMKLVMQEHPSFGAVSLFGQLVWQGWLAIPVLMWSGIPAFFLGKAKMKIAERLNDKVLVADAHIDAADWQSATAAIIGVIGIAMGIWWLDALAAMFIAIEISRDGFRETYAALGDLVDRRPRGAGKEKLDPLPEKLTAFFKEQDWVADAIVRLRESGRQFAGEALIVPTETAVDLAAIEQARADALAIDERLREITIAPVAAVSDELDRVRADRGA